MYFEMHLIIKKGYGSKGDSVAKSSLNGSKGSNFIAKLTSEWFNQEAEVCRQRTWVDVENKEPKMTF